MRGDDPQRPRATRGGPPQGRLISALAAVSDLRTCAMEPLVMFLVSALTGGENSPGDPHKGHIVVPRSHAYLADLLAKAFEGRGEVEVIVDRRRGDRRMQQEPAAVGRRRAGRRRPQNPPDEGGAGTEPGANEK